MNGVPVSPRCVACDRGSSEIPLMVFTFHGRNYWICPQHLPILIHDPKTLVGKLPGAEGMEPADHQD